MSVGIMRFPVIAFLLCIAAGSSFELMEYVKCNLCETHNPIGEIKDCTCDVETVDQANSRHFLPILSNLTRTTWFRYFKVNLDNGCPFWPDDSMCVLRDCAICTSDESEIPECWSEEDRDAYSQLTDEERIHELSSLKQSGTTQPWASSSGFGLDNSPYEPLNVWGAAPVDPSPSVIPSSQSQPQYINLLMNPEGYTGYSGPTAYRIWDAIYNENCFDVTSDSCLEVRVFYRLISGLHTSINTHIAMTYGDGRGTEADLYRERLHSSLQSQFDAKSTQGASDVSKSNSALNGEKSDFEPVTLPHHHLSLFQRIQNVLSTISTTLLSFGSNRTEPLIPRAEFMNYYPGNANLVLTPGLTPSIPMYVERISRYPERIENLYFTFIFMVRALAKAAPVLRQLDIESGNASEDAYTRELLNRLVSVEAPGLVRGFDETGLFAETDPAVVVAGADGLQADIDILRSMQKESTSDASVNQSLLPESLVDESALRGKSLKARFREKFQNISRILDCVGCEKCEVWGKLQFLGLGTAIKILFAEDDEQVAGIGHVHLSRNEVVAMVNTLHRLSMSIAAIHVMRDIEAQQLVMKWGSAAALVLFFVIFFLIAYCKKRSREHPRIKKKNE